ncbi:MAG TPA: hypothetical protein DCZ94_00695 [Lentisphaeria bacterium]|nr:MAG: hypothetical protein A2X48_12260 [Lentisphaerae bacterium GWF2_49_21]HBC85449.1 hypothetical protein [Lentisphaeria bacterium]
MKKQYETYIYKIDNNDIIYMVSDNWQKFADENNGLDNTSSRNVIGRPLWDFVSGPETTHLYQTVLKAVRDRKRKVKLLFRCDSPGTRRYLQLIVFPIENNCIEFWSQIIKTESRGSVDLLRNGIERSNDMIKMCSMCKKIEIQENVWEEIEPAINRLKLLEMEHPPKISHGLCTCCFNAIMHKVENIN